MALSGSFISDKYGSNSSGSSYLQLKVYWSASQNIGENYSIVNADVYLVIAGNISSSATKSGTMYTDGQTQNISKSFGSISSGEHYIGSSSKVVYHNADGTKGLNLGVDFGMNVTFNNKAVNLMSLWAWITLDTIPRASQPSMSDFNIGNVVYIHTNRASASFTHNIQAYFGNWSKTIATGVTDNFAWNTALDASTLFSQIPNSTSGRGTIYLDTYSNGVLVGQKSIGFMAYVVNSNPTFTDFDYQDSNEIIVALTGNNRVLVKGYSNVKAIITSLNKAVARNNASMSRYRATIGNKQIEANYSGNDVSMTINNIESAIINITAIDSRGLQTTINKTATIIDYAKINISNIILKRENGVGNKVFFELNGLYWNGSFGAVANGIEEISYRYKKKSEVAFSNFIKIDAKCIAENGNITNKTNGTNFFATTNNGNTAVSFANVDYDVEIKIIDKLDTCTRMLSIDSGIPYTAARKNSNGKYAMGINKFPRDNFDGLDIDGDVFINGNKVDTTKLVKYIRITEDSTNIVANGLNIVRDGRVYDFVLTSVGNREFNSGLFIEGITECRTRYLNSCYNSVAAHTATSSVEIRQDTGVVITLGTVTLDNWGRIICKFSNMTLTAAGVLDTMYYREGFIYYAGSNSNVTQFNFATNDYANLFRAGSELKIFKR